MKIIRSKTLIRKIEADLRAAFPDVQFSLIVPSWRPGNRTVEINWCSRPGKAAVEAVIAKHAHCGDGVYLSLHGSVPCERCGGPTRYVDDGRAFCIECEPGLWIGNKQEEAEARARLGLKRTR